MAYSYWDTESPQAQFRRCVLKDDRTVNYYLHPTNSLLKADSTPAKLDGTDGQVMVEILPTYYKRERIGSKIYSTISLEKKSDLKLHPYFYDKDGDEVVAQYFPAFEGSIFDVSGNTYLLNDEQVADFTADKLCSIAGAKPASGLTQLLTLPNSRKLANNRGVGWEQQYFTAVSFIQLMMQTEYKHNNMQLKIGNGVISIPDDGASNMTIFTGATSSLGNKSGKVSVTHPSTGQTTYAVSYRGIENFWGNIFKWVDGFNIKDGFAYISNINGNFVSDKFNEQYVNVGELYHTNGYMSKALINGSFDYGFIPAEALGTSSTKYTDYYYQNSAGSFLARLGGGWFNSSVAGAFLWSLSFLSGSRDRTIGARLCACGQKK